MASTAGIYFHDQIFWLIDTPHEGMGLGCGYKTGSYWFLSQEPPIIFETLVFLQISSCGLFWASAQNEGSHTFRVLCVGHLDQHHGFHYCVAAILISPSLTVLVSFLCFHFHTSADTVQGTYSVVQMWEGFCKPHSPLIAMSLSIGVNDSMGSQNQAFVSA